MHDGMTLLFRRATFSHTHIMYCLYAVQRQQALLEGSKGYAKKSAFDCMASSRLCSVSTWFSNRGCSWLFKLFLQYTPSLCIVRRHTRRYCFRILVCCLQYSAEQHFSPPATVLGRILLFQQKAPQLSLCSSCCIFPARKQIKFNATNHHTYHIFSKPAIVE